MIGLQTIIDRLARTKKAAAPVSVHEALDASRVLDTDPKTRLAKYRDAAGVLSVGNPLVRAVGRSARFAAVAAPGNRLRAAAKGFASTNRGELAQHVTEGLVGGVGLKAVQEGLEVGRAKRKVTSFLNSPVTQKTSEYRNEFRDVVDLKARQAEADIQELPKELRSNIRHTVSKLVMFARDGMDLDARKIDEKTATAFKGKIQDLSDKVRSQKLAPIASPDLDFEV